MYRIFLSILLTTFLFAQEYRIDTLYHKDGKSLIKAYGTFSGIREGELEKKFKVLINSKIIQLLNPESFIIDVNFNETMGDWSYTEKLIDNKLKKNFVNLTSKEITIKIFIDESIYNDAINNSVMELIKSVEPGLSDCNDCISFTSVDMDSLRGLNETVKSTVSLNRDDIYDDSWAVIIGIDKYKYSKQLNYAVKDAAAVKEMLISKFDFPKDNIKYLVNEEATLSEIKLALNDIATSADENDRILVFYSGHGETLPTKDESEIGYIIPYEGRQNKPYVTGLAMDEVLRTCQLSNAKHMLFLMDACYSGLMTQQFKGLSKPTEEGYLTKVANESARQILTAGGRDEQVIERDEWQHSAFTKNLLEGLETWDADYNNDGCITADELSSYLREHVTEDSDGLQTPQDGRFRNSGGGEFVFFGTGDTKTEAEISLIKEKKDENLKEELFDSYEYDKELIQAFREHKRQDIISKLANNPPKSTHSFFLNGYQYNKDFLNPKKEWSFSLLVLNQLDYAFAVGIKNFSIEDRTGLYWGYNLLILGTLKEEGHLHPLPRVYLGKQGFLPSLEFGYRLSWISSIRYGISGTKKGRRKMRPFYITAKLNLYPLKDEVFNLPINELYKGIVLSPNVGMEAPINWWNKNIK